jgi:hypothetical protein
MLHDEDVLKLHAAGYDEDETSDSEIDEVDEDDES